ncbi:MBL fold metallo-hydrolase [Caenimonas koreensis]|uniref:MBL fold metallo-hydrolase n=1 Tax=Caenimonas koreensis TaxID=367474 RepID=UPI003784C55E
MTVFERGWLSSNNILFVGPTRSALIDSGYWTHSQQTLRLVQAALGEQTLDLLINTHLHSDHCGGNEQLQVRYPALRTLIPPGQADAVRSWDTVALTYVPTGQGCPRFSIDDVLNPGTTLLLGDRQWQVHAAPGHDPHSVILYEPQSRVLVSADALWENGFGVVFPELEGDDGFDGVASTLDLIESLAPHTIVPGHGPVFHDLAAALNVARSRLAAFRASPRKHAGHAAKVLLKFKLLELQEMSFESLESWGEKTPYFRLVFARYFGETGFSNWMRALASGLVHSGAAVISGDRILNN